MNTDTPQQATLAVDEVLNRILMMGGSEPEHLLADEVRRLREREAIVRKLAAWTIEAAAGHGNGPWIRREWSRWLETE